MDKKESSKLSTIIWQPTTIQEALAIITEYKTDSCFISGGTLLQIQWEKGNKMPKHLISLEHIQEMKGVDVDFEKENETLTIGALTSLGVCQSHPLVIGKMGLLSEAAQSIAASAIRNRATVGGNISGGSGDLIPAFLAMDVEVTICSVDSSKREELWCWLNKKEKQANILSQFHLPIENRKDQMIRFYKKLGRRAAFTAAIVTVAGLITWDSSGKIDRVRLAVGGGDNTPKRLVDTESLLHGEMITKIPIREVYLSILKEFTPVDDAFVSADYRRKAAANMIISQILF